MKAKTIRAKRPGSDAVAEHLSVSPATAPKADAFVGNASKFLDQERRKDMIAEAAYYKAEHRGFASGFELDDWLAAEAEIDGALARESLLSA